MRLIEANPRYSVTADAATYAGVELGWLHYLDMLDRAPSTATEWNGKPFHHIVLRRDVECFRDYLRAGLTTRWQILQSYRNAKYFDFDWKDWRLSRETIVYVVKDLIYPTYRKIFKRAK